MEPGMKKNQKGKRQRPGMCLNSNIGLGFGSVVYHFGMKEKLFPETVFCYAAN